MRDVTREPVLSPPPAAAPVEEDDDGEINVVAVLRLLTALEEKLGSLGPKIIDLLAQALAMEKSEANSSENLLDNEVNCVMFETVKEKLKGQLLAGLVEPIQEKAFKNAIKKTASLIHMAGERKKEKEKSAPKVDPVKVSGGVWCARLVYVVVVEGAGGGDGGQGGDREADCERAGAAGEDGCDASGVGTADQCGGGDGGSEQEFEQANHDGQFLGADIEGGEGEGEESPEGDTTDGDGNDTHNFFSTS